MRVRIRTALSRDGKHTYEIIEPLETIAQKVGPGRGFAPDAFEQASSMVAELADDYQDLVLDDVEKLRGIAARARLPEADLKACWVQAQSIAHDLRSEGSTFGYPLITAIAELLYRLLRDHPSMPADGAAAVEAHVDALAAVIAGQVRGDGGSVGRELVSGLAAVRARCMG